MVSWFMIGPYDPIPDTSCSLSLSTHFRPHLTDLDSMGQVVYVWSTSETGGDHLHQVCTD